MSRESGRVYEDCTRPWLELGLVLDVRLDA
jgi:hypothetical protein